MKLAIALVLAGSFVLVGCGDEKASGDAKPAASGSAAAAPAQSGSASAAPKEGGW